jgi:hypothetical protein
MKLFAIVILELFILGPAFTGPATAQQAIVAQTVPPSVTDVKPSVIDLKSLIGRYEGFVNTREQRWTGGPNRTLVLVSPNASDGNVTTLKGQYGITGMGLSPVNVTVELLPGDRVQLRFRTGSNSEEVTLERTGPGRLTGSTSVMTLSRGAREKREFPIQLELKP